MKSEKIIVNNSKNILLLTFLLIASSLVQAQSDKSLYRNGNKLYKDGKFADAEIAYRKGLEKSKDQVTGNYNLGTALYKQGKFDEAINQYKNVATQKMSEDAKAKTFHNLGNALLETKKYDESIAAYKQALKANPYDADTKYNLAYAQAMLKQQQNQQNKDDKNKDKNKDKEKNKNKEKQDKDKKDEQNKDQKQDKKDQEQQKKEQQQKPEQKLSQQDAERLLQALSNKEKDLQKKMGKKEAGRVSVEKDW